MSQHFSFTCDFCDKPMMMRADNSSFNHTVQPLVPGKNLPTETRVTVSIAVHAAEGDICPDCAFRIVNGVLPASLDE